jgi:uncharacterized protein with GYD domain
MQTYYMLGSYPSGAVKQISALRTEECARIIEGLGGQIILMDALLGQYDLAFITKFSDNSAAFKASLALMKVTGVNFTAMPAIPVSEFDQLAVEI